MCWAMHYTTTLLDTVIGTSYESYVRDTKFENMSFVNHLYVYVQTHNPELGILSKSGASFVIQVSSLLLKALLSSLAKQETP